MKRFEIASVKVGAFKQCGKCGHRTPLTRWSREKRETTYQKLCSRCGHALPRGKGSVKFPQRARYAWSVKVTDLSSGQAKTVTKLNGHRVSSKEECEALVEHLKRQESETPVQSKLAALVLAEVRAIDAPDVDSGIDELIRRLGGDAGRRRLVQVGVDEAIRAIGDDLIAEGKTRRHAESVARIIRTIADVTGISAWSELDLPLCERYRNQRVSGDVEINGKTLKPLSARTMNLHLSVLGSFLNRCVRKGWALKNVLENQPGVRCKTVAKEAAYMPDEVLRQIIATARPLWFQTMLITSYYTAARKPDLLALRWDDVDFDGTKAASVGLTAPAVQIRNTKVGRPRWIPMPAPLVAALKALRAQRSVDPHVFPVRESHSAKETYIGRLWREARERAEKVLPKDLRRAPTGEPWAMYDLKRKSISDCRNCGASQKERQALAGHSSAAISQLYEAVEPERLRAICNRLPAFSLPA